MGNRYWRSLWGSQEKGVKVIHLTTTPAPEVLDMGAPPKPMVTYGKVYKIRGRIVFGWKFYVSESAPQRIFEQATLELLSTIVCEGLGLRRRDA